MNLTPQTIYTRLDGLCQIANIEDVYLSLRGAKTSLLTYSLIKWSITKEQRELWKHIKQQTHHCRLGGIWHIEWHASKDFRVPRWAAPNCAHRRCRFDAPTCRGRACWHAATSRTLCRWDREKRPRRCCSADPTLSSFDPRSLNAHMDHKRTFQKDLQRTVLTAVDHAPSFIQATPTKIYCLLRFVGETQRSTPTCLREGGSHTLPRFFVHPTA